MLFQILFYGVAALTVVHENLSHVCKKALQVAAQIPMIKTPMLDTLNNKLDTFVRNPVVIGVVSLFAYPLACALTYSAEALSTLIIYVAVLAYIPSGLILMCGHLKATTILAQLAEWGESAAQIWHKKESESEDEQDNDNDVVEHDAFEDAQPNSDDDDDDDGLQSE